MSTPIFDELEEKWNWTINQRNICDQYWTVTHTATGQEWFEDDEGNEVLPGMSPTLEELNEGVDLTAYIVPNEVKEGDTVTPVKLGEPQYSPGGYIGQFPELHKAIFEDRTYCPVSNVEVDRPKRKFKLLGRNQGTNGTL